MSNKKISIIVPCYNQVQYLDGCLQSVLDQTYTNWECLIIDDGSPDNTEDLAKIWVEKDERFHYFKKENGGVSSARNFGIEKAKGEWILPLDGDDKIGKNYLNLAAKEFSKNYSVIYCNAEFFGKQTGSWDLSDYSFQKLLIKNHIFCSAFFLKKDWLQCGGYDQSFVYGMEDWDFWLSILNPESEVLKLDYTGFYYRRKDESRDTLLNASDQKKRLTESKIYTKHLLYYLNLDPNPIKNFEQQTKNTEKLELLNREIKKNNLTKFLYKLIEKL